MGSFGRSETIKNECCAQVEKRYNVCKTVYVIGPAINLNQHARLKVIRRTQSTPEERCSQAKHRQHNTLKQFAKCYLEDEIDFF